MSKISSPPFPTNARADDRIVIGGFRDVLPNRETGVFDDGGLDPVVSQHLRAYLPQRFPSKFGMSPLRSPPHFEMEWSGILGFTKDRRGSSLRHGSGSAHSFLCANLIPLPPISGFPWWGACLPWQRRQ